MTTEKLHTNSILAKINFWFNVQYRRIILKKTDEFSIVTEQGSDTAERVTGGAKVVSELAGSVSDVMPRTLRQNVSHISTKGAAPDAVAIVGVAATTIAAGPIKSAAVTGLVAGATTVLGVATLASHALGFGSVTTGLIEAAGFAGGATVGAVVAPKVFEGYAKKDPKLFERIDNGVAIGGSLGGVIGGFVGSFIPVVGTAIGTVIGTGLGSLIGGSSAAIAPSLHRFFKSEKLKLFMKVGTTVGAAVGAIIGTVVAPVLGTATGAAIGGFVGAVAGVCTYKIYKSVKSIINTVSAVKENNALSKEAQAETKAKNKELVRDLALAVTICSAVGGLVGGPIGAGVGAVVGLAWVGFRKVTEGTVVGNAIDNAIKKVKTIAFSIKNFISDKLEKIFSPAPKQVEMQNYVAEETKDETSYSSLLETMATEKQAEVAQRKSLTAAEIMSDKTDVLKRDELPKFKPVTPASANSARSFWKSANVAESEVQMDEFVSSAPTFKVGVTA